MSKRRAELIAADHPRALAAGRAMATWGWARSYTLAHRLGDFVPRVALAGSWVGKRQALKDAAKLVEVGLFVEVNDGWRTFAPGRPARRRQRSAASLASIAGALRLVPPDPVSEDDRTTTIVRALDTSARAVAKYFKGRSSSECECVACSEIEALRTALLDACRRCRWTASRADLDQLDAERSAFVECIVHPSTACVRRPPRRLP